MKIVQPIRDKNKINEMKVELRKKRNKRLLIIYSRYKYRTSHIRYNKIKSFRCLKRR